MFDSLISIKFKKLLLGYKEFSIIEYIVKWTEGILQNYLDFQQWVRKQLRHLLGKFIGAGFFQISKNSVRPVQSFLTK